MRYFKSPMNYMGGKHKLLPQIEPLFPQNINTFVDLFCGGLDVSLNINAANILCNDKESHIIDFYKEVQNRSSEEVHNSILNLIEKYKLSKENAEGYKSLREDYNLENRWDKFYTLLCYSFNNQIRYNKEGKFNMPFGKNRSSYNNRLQGRLKEFIDKIDYKYNFSSLDFRDIDLDSLTSESFVYCDPPYLITVATYNENGGWSEKDEKDLLDLLDKLNEKGIKFGLSNVISQNGKINELLDEWSKKYTIHDLTYNYSNCSYHKKDRSTEDTREVFICNY